MGADRAGIGFAPRCRHWRWHVDEVYVRINGETDYLWCAVDHEGEVLENYGK
jgi:putative transposase